jgi:TRAP-type mannitol/chloroaromatic compound transport system substrate-binding protein
MLAGRITTLSGGRIDVKVYAAGGLASGRGVLDTVSEGDARPWVSAPKV